MKQKLFYQAFSIINNEIRNYLSLNQKEEVYRLLFKSVYLATGDEMFGNDQIRKITSGSITIHSRVVKYIHTEKGFDLFRKSIEENCLSCFSNRKNTFEQLSALLDLADNIPSNVKTQLILNVDLESDYQLSKSIAGILDCLNYSDYLVSKGKESFINVDYMRLYSHMPLAQYPKYITDPLDAAIDELMGRKEELNELNDLVLIKGNALLVSAVGGLGKTELVKKFLSNLLKRKTYESGIEVVAWVSYSNNDIRLSIKGAFHLKCELEDVWSVVWEIISEYRQKLLLVIDNIENSEDEFLNKLYSLPCRIIVTSRQRELLGFKQTLVLKPLKMESCRELFYKHYTFHERNNETLNDIINLTSRLTIMIVFIAKAACLEEIGLNKLYERLVAKGFKLSDEDVSCEHEKMHNDETIIKQMCILFSLVKYSDEDKKILTYISIIPNLQFDFAKAKKWFSIKKNSSLMKLFKMGMLEQVTTNKKHIYWIHSVIAAAVREQQKEHLYDISRPFVDIMADELDFQKNEGREYEKAYLIPFSWSIADIMESHWNNERDTLFLNNLFHICFACSNYSLCETLIEKVIEIQSDPKNDFDFMELAFSYRNKIDLLLQYDRASEASELLEKAAALFSENNATDSQRGIMDFQYGVLYQIRADFEKSKVYMQNCIDKAETDDSASAMDKSTSYYNMGRMLLDAGEYFAAYDYIKKAIELDSGEDNASKIISYCTLASICTDLISLGYTEYTDEARDCFVRTIKFREKNLGKLHADTAVAYHDYALFLLTLGYYDKSQLDEALKYNEKAGNIEIRIFSENSVTRMRNLNTKALILDEMGRQDEALELYKHIIEKTEKMSSDYETDLALFIYNYGQALRDRGLVDEAIPLYERCIKIWSGLSESGNRNLAQAYMGYGECKYLKGDKSVAIDIFKKAIQYVHEDLYLQLSLLDNIAAIYIMLNNNDEGVSYYVEMLEKMTDYDVTDAAVKTEFCNNLANVLSAKYDYEKELKAQIIKQVQSNAKILTYIEDFFDNIS